MPHVPEATSPVWSDVILGRRSVQLEHIGARMLLVRLRIDHGRTPGPDTLARCVSALRDLFVQNQDHRTVKTDLRRIQGLPVTT